MSIQMNVKHNSQIKPTVIKVFIYTLSLESIFIF